MILSYHYHITLSMLGKNFSRQDFEINFFLCFQENGLWYYMQIVSLIDNLLEMSYPSVWENKKNIVNLSAEFTRRLVNVEDRNLNIKDDLSNLRQFEIKLR